MNDPLPPPRRVLLHVGCGRTPLPGWVNVDLQLLPGVDVVADATAGLCFRDVSAAFAEHFLEHLSLDEAIGFLAEVHRVLAPGGWLRLSTPNLEWVLATHFRPAGSAPGADRGTLELNRAFYGWEHRFLWDRSFLERTLHACGFDDLEWPAYGESPRAWLRNLERHERSDDFPGLPHVLIVEARRGPARPDELAALCRLAEERFLGHFEEARLRRARLDIERLSREKGMLGAEVMRLASEATHLREELTSTAAHLEEARARIAWMEASRFWKARDRWFRIKAALGLVPRDR
ncbi:MAG TPA: methyltransferase domain-containing protein [Thermoanaerobaculia bacterium]|nr:methyltransferase domain-containing protein [Thermoanaerobaculia bacterium]